MDPTLENNCKVKEEKGPMESEVEVTRDQETEESVEGSDEEPGESSGENTSGDISGVESGDDTGDASGDETGEASDDETQKPNGDISAEESDDGLDEGPGEENDNTSGDVSADEDREDLETPSGQSHPEPDMSIVNNNSGMEEVDVSDGQKPGQNSDRLSEEITSQQSMEESVEINRQSPASLNQQDDIRDSRDSSNNSDNSDNNYIEKPDVEIDGTTNPSDQVSREDQDIIDVLIPFDYQKYTDTHPTLVSHLKDRNLINEIARNIFGNTSLSNWLESCYQQKRKLAAAELLLEKITTGVENIVINAENQIKIPSIAGLVRSEGNYQFIILLRHTPHNISFYPLEDWIKKGGHLDLEPYEKATFFFFRLTEYEKEQIGLMINEPWMEKLLQDS